MELGLSLGEAPPPKPFPFAAEKGGLGLGLGFCMGLGRTPGLETRWEREEERDVRDVAGFDNRRRCSPGSPPLQLELLPFSPVPRRSSGVGGAAAATAVPSPGPSLPQLGFHWSPEQGNSEGWNRSGTGGLDVNRAPSAEGLDGGASQPVASSPNSAASSFQVDYRLGGAGGSSDGGGGAERCDGERAASSRNSDEEENGLARKKLRLSKEQSAFLEESFKEHNTLNPKQKLALAKQLNLRPRQVEVWFQNRRARTKLKQTEVDCEYLKRCCEKLTEENRRLQKELQELRALKTSPHPYYMHLPATTLTMCPSCERVASTTTAPPASANNSNNNAPVKDSQPPSGFPIRPKSVYPFGQQSQNHQQQQQIAAAAAAAPHQQPSPAAATT